MAHDDHGGGVGNWQLVLGLVLLIGLLGYLYVHGAKNPNKQRYYFNPENAKLSVTP